MNLKFQVTQEDLEYEVASALKLLKKQFPEEDESLTPELQCILGTNVDGYMVYNSSTDSGYSITFDTEKFQEIFRKNPAHIPTLHDLWRSAIGENVGQYLHEVACPDIYNEFVLQITEDDTFLGAVVSRYSGMLYDNFRNPRVEPLRLQYNITDECSAYERAKIDGFMLAETIYIRFGSKALPYLTKAGSVEELDSFFPELDILKMRKE